MAHKSAISLRLLHHLYSVTTLAKRLRFGGFPQTLRALKIYLLTYLLTYSADI